MFVFEVGRENQFDERVAEKELILPIVETEAHFVEVSREMLRRDFMPRTHDAALEQGERRFHGVSVNVSVRVFSRVIDSLMQVLLHLIERVRIDGGFISQNHFHMAANVCVDDVPHSLGFGILSANQPEIAIALTDANYHRYFALWTPPTLFASHVGFVNLDCAVQFLRRYLKHGSADAMAEIPCRLVADSKGALNLAGAHSFFGFAEQVGC